jgi:hypothetical protein
MSVANPTHGASNENLNDGGDGPARVPYINETAQLLDDLVAYLKRYLVLTDAYYLVVAAWILHAAAIRAFEITPRLIIRSVVKRSGKSRLISAIELVLPNASSEVNPKPASLIRAIDASGGNEAILFDEVDLYFNPKAGEDKSDVQAVLNSGFERGRTVKRYDVTSRSIQALSVFAPVAFGSIDKLPDTLEDRGIVITIHRKLTTEIVSRFLRHKVKAETKALRERISVWARVDTLSGLRAAEPELPEDLDDRAADIWWPLFVICDHASAEYAERIRAAAKDITNARVDDDDSMAIKLLRGIWKVWPDDQTALAVSGERLTQLLNEDDELPFGGWKEGTGISTRSINQFLGKFGIKTKDVKVEGRSRKGFHVDQFRDPWMRYLGVRSATSDRFRDHPATDPQPDSSSSSGNVGVQEGMAEKEDNTRVYHHPQKPETPRTAGFAGLVDGPYDPDDEGAF